MRGQTLNDACLLGLLKQLSEISAPDAADQKIADELLMKYTGRNLYFAFYKKFGGDNDPENIICMISFLWNIIQRQTSMCC